MSRHILCGRKLQSDGVIESHSIQLLALHMTASLISTHRFNLDFCIDTGVIEIHWTCVHWAPTGGFPAQNGETFTSVLIDYSIIKCSVMRGHHSGFPFSFMHQMLDACTLCANIPSLVVLQEYTQY